MPSRRNQKGIGVNGPSIHCNDISQLSAGELTLYALALSIVKEWDIFHNDDNLKLEDITGCVLIDEADANLHIDFAYRALPALMKMFPKVQFILSKMNANPLEILDGSNTKKVYKMNCEDATNYALTKDDFVQHIINNDSGFDSFSFDGFRPTLDMIKAIVQDAEGN